MKLTQQADIKNIISFPAKEIQIWRLLTAELQITENQENVICGSVTRELSIQQTPSVELEETYPIPNELLLFEL